MLRNKGVGIKLAISTAAFSKISKMHKNVSISAVLNIEQCELVAKISCKARTSIQNGVGILKTKLIK